MFLQTFDAPVDDRFIFTVKTDNAGISASNQFFLQVSSTPTPNYNIETSDGQFFSGITGSATITFPTPGIYEIKLSGLLPQILFNNNSDHLKILEISNFGTLGTISTSYSGAFNGCSNMVITAIDSGNFGAVTNFASIFRLCSSIETMPFINVSSSLSFAQSWRVCSSLQNFPANFFDGCLATNFTLAFSGTNLSQTSIDNILVSIESNGTSNGTFSQSGGNAPSATGEAAIDALRARGWTITVTGGY